jgi:hypothetical protein
MAILVEDHALKPTNRLPRETQLLGLGLDNEDGHKRMTRGDNFDLLGGSEETHSRMQETTIKLQEKLQKTGRRIADVPPKELGEILRDTMG